MSVEAIVLAIDSRKPERQFRNYEAREIAMIRLAMLAAAFAAIGAVAQTEPASGTAPSAVAPAVVKNKKLSANRMVCEDEETLGTRLGGHRVCKTSAQWMEEREQTRVEVDRAQNTRGICAPPTC